MKPTVLCVDDENIEHKEYLRELGQSYNVINAFDSKGAREKLKRETIDAILMDFQLGFENGILVAGELKNEGFTQPILIVSKDYPETATVEIAKAEYGIYNFVIKDPKVYKPILGDMIKGLAH